MVRIVFTSLFLLLSFFLYGQATGDSGNVLLNVEYEFFVINGYEYNRAIQSGFDPLKRGDTKGGFNKIKAGLDDFFSEGNADRALSYFDLEFYSLLQLYLSDSLSEQEKEVVVQFMVGLFSGRIEIDREFGNMKKTPGTESFYLRMQLLGANRRGESEAMNQYLDAYLEAVPGSLAANSLKGGIAFGRKDYESALKWYSRTIELSPQYAYAYMVRGLCYNEMDMYLDAEKELRESLLLFPTNPMAITQLAIACQETERYAEAIEYYKEAYVLDSSFTEVYNNIGNCFRKLDQLDSALYYFDRALYYEPELPFIYLNIAQVYYDKEEYEVSKYIYSKTLDLDPDNIPGLTGLAEVYFKDRNYTRAIEEFEKVLAIDPDNANTYLRIGDSYYLDKQYEKAIIQYDRAIQLDSTNYDLFYMAGTCYLELGNNKQTIAYLGKAVELNPSHSSSWTNLGWIYYLEGDYQKCLYCSKKSYAADPDDYISKYNAALATLRLGRVEKSYELYRKVYDESAGVDISGAETDLNDLIEQGIMVKESKYILKNILIKK